MGSQPQHSSRTLLCPGELRARAGSEISIHIQLTRVTTPARTLGTAAVPRKLSLFSPRRADKYGVDFAGIRSVPEGLSYNHVPLTSETWSFWSE